MDIKTYQNESVKFLNNELSTREKVLNMCLGISGESGEVNDAIKKFMFQGHQINLYDLEEELGDVCWYLVNLATLFNLDMESILERNYNKLSTRYPKGFSIEDSIARVDKQ